MDRNAFGHRVLLAAMEDELHKIAAAGKAGGLMGLIRSADRKVMSVGRSIRRGKIAIKGVLPPKASGAPRRDLVLRKGRSDPKFLQGDKRRAIRNMIDRLLGVGVPTAAVAAGGAGAYYGGKAAVSAYRRHQNK